MKNVFSDAGKRALRVVMARQPFLAFDFDGTLAPIVARPERALAPVAVARRLAQLTALRPVAIITGRQVSDVRSRLGFTPQFIIGNHGAEWEQPGIFDIDPARLDPARTLLRANAAELAAYGAWVEDKGLSLAVHYRGVRDPAGALEFVRELLARLPPALEVFAGKQVLNVVPGGAPDKGAALLRLVDASGADSAVFIGDDVNDEAVFAIAPPHWFTVRVGAAPDGSAALFFIDTQAQVPLLLQDMIDLLSRQSARSQR
jgi:trehalose 6-phosphate phosphatase